jgi:hypothetical protein
MTNKIWNAKRFDEEFEATTNQCLLLWRHHAGFCLEDVQDSEHRKIKGIMNLTKTPKASMGFYHLCGGCRGDLAYSFKSLPVENWLAANIST